jgi:phenylalanyl-tRNA synthetase beta chain
MIVTRSWLNEFIDLEAVSDKKLYETFNAIGLEVDSMKKIEIDPHVVVGKILSCEKHPDADKLNVCQIDVGTGVRQIVCGAANVVDAEYVAVATIGAVLPGDFKIKHAKLRGVESEGMVCASQELGLPEMGKGIMILDESIGTLEIGKPLNDYPTVADTIIELELTANRGDCLSIYGVARDLSAALDIEMTPFEYRQEERMKLGIAREAELHTEGEMDADLRYKLATISHYDNAFLVSLRLSMVGVEAEGRLAKMLAYVIHTTGVILRGYKSDVFADEMHKIVVRPRATAKGIIEIIGNEKVQSVVGVCQSEASIADETTEKIVIETSYIHPDLLVEAVSQTDLKPDDFYYKTSRGSNPDLDFGLLYFAFVMDRYTDINCYEGSLDVRVDREPEKVVVDAREVSTIIGMDIDLNRIITILQKLGFEVSMIGEHRVKATIPLFRHDIKNIQDITEEIVRIVGINNIDSQPLCFTEEMRLNDTIVRYKAKRAIKNRAVGNGFFENISYLFASKEQLQKYGFPILPENLDLANPIAEELNTLRTTIVVNLLNAAQRNVNYSHKKVPLFEIGAIFDTAREQKEVLSFIYAGQSENESVINSGKPEMIDFGTFVEKIGGIIGSFGLRPCTEKNALIHPYQSADIIIDGQKAGYLSKLHPVVQEAFGIPVTFFAEVALEKLMPQHINAEQISKFQGVYKDLSVVIGKSIRYDEVEDILSSLDIPMLKSSYPVDIYQDEQLGEKKSLTIRFFIQSDERTLEDEDIENVMQQVMEALTNECQATLR